MKSYTKKELANMAGVSKKTFASWLRSIEPQLASLGYKKNMKMLPPHIVKCIIEYYCIETGSKGK